MYKVLGIKDDLATTILSRVMPEPTMPANEWADQNYDHD